MKRLCLGIVLASCVATSLYAAPKMKAAPKAAVPAKPAAATESMKMNDEVKTDIVNYADKDTALEGFIAYPSSASVTPKPGVLVVHAWKGLGEYEKMRAKQLAELGYVALAADIYGKGVRPTSNMDAMKTSSMYKKDRALMRERAMVGLDFLRKNPMVDPKRVAVIGYCFGGTCALEVARSGADVAGVVAFHGGLDTATTQDAKNIKTSVLVLHGADDPYVNLDQVRNFENEMRGGNVADWQVVLYSGAVHAFSDPASGNDPSKGIAYNASADKRSWKAMKDFFKEIFASK